MHENSVERRTFAMVVASKVAILAPDLEAQTGAGNQPDLELGEVVLFLEVVPMPVLPFHVRRAQHGNDFAEMPSTFTLHACR